MHTKFKTFTYLVAFIIIMFPIVLEKLGNPVGEVMETVLLTVGLLVLFFGKLNNVNKLKRSGQRTGSHDMVILAVILFMIAYVLYNFFV